MKKIFIGSSSSAMKKAKNVQRILSQLGEEQVVCWFDPGVFIPGDSTLDKLLQLTRECQAAIFIFDKDDELTDASGTKKYVTRDNVILEAGLFISALGKDAVVLCHVPEAHMLTDYSGVTRLLYDADDPDRMKEILKEWLDHRVRGDRVPRSENNVFMKSRKTIHTRYSLADEFQLNGDGFSHIHKIRLMNMAENLVISPEYADPAHESPEMRLSEVIRSVLEKTNAILEFMLLAPNEPILKDAAMRMPNPSARTPEEFVYGSWKSICEKVNSDPVYKEAYQSSRFRCFALRLGMPYAIFGVEYDAEYARYNHVKIDLYSACIGDESNRRSFVIWQDTDPQNYEFFIQNFDNLRGNRSVCYSVEPTQNIAAEVLNRMKLSEVEHKLQKSPMDSELLISKAGLLYDMDHHNYSQAVQVLLSAMYFSPDCFEAYDKLVEIAVAEEDSQRVSRWSSGVAVLARPEGSKHTRAKENRQQNPLSKRGTNSLDRCALKHLK